MPKIFQSKFLASILILSFIFQSCAATQKIHKAPSKCAKLVSYQTWGERDGKNFTMNMRGIVGNVSHIKLYDVTAEVTFMHNNEIPITTITVPVNQLMEPGQVSEFNISKTVVTPYDPTNQITVIRYYDTPNH